MDPRVRLRIICHQEDIIAPVVNGQRIALSLLLGVAPSIIPCVVENVTPFNPRISGTTSIGAFHRVRDRAIAIPQFP